jgi:hypothetical protein
MPHSDHYAAAHAATVEAFLNRAKAREEDGDTLVSSEELSIMCWGALISEHTRNDSHIKSEARKVAKACQQDKLRCSLLTLR